MKILSSIILCSAVFVFVACKNNKPQEDISQKVKTSAIVYADPAFVNITEELANVYESMNDTIDFVVKAMPETDAIRMMANDSAMLIVTSRLLTTQETQALDSHQKKCREFVVGQDAVVFVTQAKPKDTAFTKEELLAILTGETPNKNLVFDANNSATVTTIGQVLGNKKLSTNAFAAQSVEELLKYVSNNKNSIGIFGSNYFSNLEEDSLVIKFEGLKIIGVKEDKKVFYPFQADIAAKKYPFARTVYILTSEHYYGPYSGFKNYVISAKGQRLVLKAGLVPTLMPSRLLNFVKKRSE